MAQTSARVVLTSSFSDRYTGGIKEFEIQPLVSHPDLGRQRFRHPPVALAADGRHLEARSLDLGAGVLDYFGPLIQLPPEVTAEFLGRVADGVVPHIRQLLPDFGLRENGIEAYKMLRGAALAAAINAPTDRAGSDGLATSKYDNDTRLVTGAKSPTVS